MTAVRASGSFTLGASQDGCGAAATSLGSHSIIQENGQQVPSTLELGDFSTALGGVGFSGGHCFPMAARGQPYGSYHSAGVRVLFSSKFPGTIDEAHNRSDYEGHILQILINIDDLDIQLLNVYAPNVPKDRRNFFDSLSEYIKSHTPFIMGGDWNCNENILSDKFGGDQVSDPPALASLQELLQGKKTVGIF